MPQAKPRRSRRRSSGEDVAKDAKPGRPDQRSDQVSRAYRELRQLIVCGQLAPGVRISERVVADRLGLSRTPVRSALHRLQQEGFVSSAGLGREQRLIVAPMLQSDAREVMLIVGHLEGLAARMAAELPPQRRKQIARRLRELNRELAAQRRKPAVSSRVFELDLEFHGSYVDDVVGPRLLALHQAIKPQSERYSRLYVSVLLDELPSLVAEHAVIATAIEKGNAADAQLAVETNWRNAANRLARVMAEYGERGIWHAWGVRDSVDVDSALGKGR
ncbi:MAG TPA: GntR family transcriptional regulator [Gemmatimonadaceae bacterium]|jgi:GntR family transcriptional regulator of vanillate catabolism|nr:GntR family transcriptional regulator [Gemmatimonadaceae bacterium]